MHEGGCDPDVGDIGNPELIKSGDRQVLDQVGVFRIRTVAVTIGMTK
jgi:hypothetical protein